MFTPWVRLPIELKAMVLEHAVHAAEPIDYARHCRNLERKGCLDALIGTRNHEVTQLSIERYYSINTFVLTAMHPLLFLASSEPRRPQRRCARMIRHLDFSLHFSLLAARPELVLFDRMCPWTFVFTAKSSLEASASNSIGFAGRALSAEGAKLWCDFDNLQTFKASVTIDSYSSVLDVFLSLRRECFCNNLPGIAKFLIHSRLGFKAKKCAVTLKVPDCASGDCSTRLNAVLEAAISTEE